MYTYIASHAQCIFQCQKLHMTNYTYSMLTEHALEYITSYNYINISGKNYIPYSAIL